MSFTLTSWMELFLRLGLGALGVFGAVVLVARFSRSGNWLRTLWRSAFVAWLLLLGAEVTGVGGLLWQSLAAQSPRRLVPTIQTGRLAGAAEAPANSSEMTYRILPGEPQGLRRGAWWPGIVWVLISVMLIWRSALTRIWLMWKWRARSEVSDPLVLGRARRVAGIFGLTRVRWMQSDTLVSPIAFGLVRPTVCLPSSFASDFTGEQQEAILAHELAHLAGRDPVWYALAEVVCALWWWNPLVWVGRRRVFAASESAADEAVIRLGQGPGVLAECLVLLGRRLVEAGSPVMMGMGGTGLRSGLAHRVTRLLEMDGRPFPRVSWLQRWLLRPLVVIGVVTLGIATLGLQTHSLGSGTVKDTGWNSSLLGQTWAALSPRIVHPSLVDQHDTSSGQAQVPAFSSPSNDADTTRWIENIHWPKQPHQQTNFFTRTFQISSNEFSRLRNHPLFQELPGDVTLTSTAPLKNFDSETQGLVLIRGFARAGFVIDPPKQLYYNARTGLLMIRAELRDLELVERLLVSAMSPSQIGIEANFIETSPETAAKSGLFGMVGKDSPLPLPGVLSRGVPHVVLRFDPVAGEPGEEVEETVRPRVLSPSLVRTFLKGLENVPGVNILSSPTVLTLSGHQAQIQAKQSKSVVLGTHRPPTGAPLPVTQVVEVGPQLDVIPRFLPEINQVDLRLVASLTEFIGYDKNAAAAQDPDDPRPVFQLRQVSRSAYLKDGESLAFCLGSDAPGVEAVALQHPSVSGTRRGNRVVFVLVTATLVDAAGNRLNPE